MAAGAGWPGAKDSTRVGSGYSPSKPRGRTLAAMLGRMDCPGRVTQQTALWSGSRGKARPGGLDLHSFWSSDGPSSLHYYFKRIWAMVHFPKDYAAAALNFTINLLKQTYSLY